MQNPDRDSVGEEANVDSGEGAEGFENQTNFAEGEAPGEAFDSDQPIVIQGGGTPQG
jgi:hypothetical protein